MAAIFTQRRDASVCGDVTDDGVVYRVCVDVNYDQRCWNWKRITGEVHLCPFVSLCRINLHQHHHNHHHYHRGEKTVINQSISLFVKTYRVMLCWTLSQTSALARITGGLRVREKVGVHYSYVRYSNDEVTHCLTLTMTLSSIYLSWIFRNSGLQNSVLLMLPGEKITVEDSRWRKGKEGEQRLRDEDTLVEIMYATDDYCYCAYD